MKDKEFDCVQMKWDIEQKLQDEERHYGKAEARRRRDERLHNDPILGPFLQRVEAYERRMTSEKLEQMAGRS